MGKLFGTDGVRGKINDDLTVQLAMNIGVAAGYVLGKNKKVKVCDFFQQADIKSIKAKSNMQSTQTVACIDHKLSD